MNLPSGYSRELIEGLAVELDAWGIGTYTPGGDVPADAERAILFGPNEPAIAPDGRILITAMQGIDYPNRVTVTPVGFNWRGAPDGDPLEGSDVLDLLRRRLHKLTHHQFGTVAIGQVRRQSGGGIGRDTRRRYGVTATYLFRGFNPSANE